LEIIKEIDKLVYGSRLIDRTDLRSKTDLKMLYSDLSNFTHPSHEKLRPVIEEKKFGQILLSGHSKELFDLCYVFTNRVMDALLFILMSFNDKIRRDIKNNETLVDFLRDNNCKLSLNKLERV